MSVRIIEIVMRVCTGEPDLVNGEGFLEEITFKTRFDGRVGISQKSDRGS